MKWLVQEMLTANENVLRWAAALDKQGIEYLWVRVNADKTLSVVDNQTKEILDKSEQVLKSFLETGPVSVYGSKTLSRIAQERGIKPGSFSNEIFDFGYIKEKMAGQLLNDDSRIGDLWSLEPYQGKFFARPAGNNKLFDGLVLTEDEFKAWQKRELREPSRFQGQNLLIAPLQKIQSEFRFFVVDHQLISGSSYRIEGKVDTSHLPTEKMKQYTERMVRMFPIAKSFVIDIAETAKGFKIVEYNNINTSGLYGCDAQKIVQAFENNKRQLKS